MRTGTLKNFPVFSFFYFVSNMSINSNDKLAQYIAHKNDNF